MTNLIIDGSLIFVIALLLVFLSKPKKKRLNTVYDLKRDVDYKVLSYEEPVAGESPGAILIELLNGEFAGVSYSYGQIGQIQPNEDDDNATLSFEYDIVNSNDKGDLEQNDDFRNYIGEVLVSILLSSMEERKRIDAMMNDIKIIED